MLEDEDAKDLQRISRIELAQGGGVMLLRPPPPSLPQRPLRLVWKQLVEETPPI